MTAFKLHLRATSRRACPGQKLSGIRRDLSQTVDREAQGLHSASQPRFKVMTNDDFLVPGDVDLSTNCDIDQDAIHKGTILRAFACLSIAAYLYLFWMYFVVKTPVLKRHPTRKYSLPPASYVLSLDLISASRT
jgi:hypothetical protein